MHSPPPRARLGQLRHPQSHSGDMGGRRPLGEGQRASSPRHASHTIGARPASGRGCRSRRPAYFQQPVQVGRRYQRHTRARHPQRKPRPSSWKHFRVNAERRGHGRSDVFCGGRQAALWARSARINVWHRPRLSGTSLEHETIQHLLGVRTGTPQPTILRHPSLAAKRSSTNRIGVVMVQTPRDETRLQKRVNQRYTSPDSSASSRRGSLLPEQIVIKAIGFTFNDSLPELDNKSARVHVDQTIQQPQYFLLDA